LLTFQQCKGSTNVSSSPDEMVIFLNLKILKIKLYQRSWNIYRDSVAFFGTFVFSAKLLELLRGCEPTSPAELPDETTSAAPASGLSPDTRTFVWTPPDPAPEEKNVDWIPTLGTEVDDEPLLEKLNVAVVGGIVEAKGLEDDEVLLAKLNAAVVGADPKGLGFVDVKENNLDASATVPGLTTPKLNPLNADA